jgi:hypothetical protein
VLQYDAVGQLGIKGSSTNPAGFPELTGLGGAQSLGPTNANSYFDGTLSAAATTTYIHGNHTSKLGAEWRLNSWTDRNSRGAQGIYNFSANETADPYNNTASVNGNGVSGSTGNGYASFLLGQVDTATVNTVQAPQAGLGSLYPGHVESHAEVYARLRSALGSAELGPRNPLPLDRVRPLRSQSGREQHTRRNPLSRLRSRTL